LHNETNGDWQEMFVVSVKIGWPLHIGYATTLRLDSDDLTHTHTQNACAHITY